MTSIELLQVDGQKKATAWVELTLIASVPLVIWTSLVSKLATDWSTNTQYEFGYFVPLFIVYLLGRRWMSRPMEATLHQFRFVAVAGILLLFLLLPLRVFQEANPDWRPLNWVHASVVVAVTLVQIAFFGGWRWVQYFSIPLLLIFSALPWPLATEQAVLQGLGGAVTTVTVELLNIINIPALQRGNVIDIPTGAVGVEDACSGIRSLAGTIMASLFFGEFYRLGYPKRLALLIGGCCISLGLNLCRAFFLSWRAAIEGVESVNRWHDPAGFTIFAVAFGSLWLLASLIGKSETEPHLSENIKLKPPRLQYRWIVFCLVWVMAVEILCEFWYHTHERNRKASLAWDIRWPQQNEFFRFKDVPQETRSILRYSSGKAAEFGWDDGTSWLVFFFNWAPGRSSVQLATMHRPEVCLPAVGYKYIEETAPYQLKLAEVTLPFSGTIFEFNGEKIYVYRCLWEDHPIENSGQNRGFDMSLKGRVLGAWYGRRNLGQRMLQIAMVGVRSEDEARTQLAHRLGNLVGSKG